MGHISLSSQKNIQAFQTETYQECFNSLNKEYHNRVKALIKEIAQNPLLKSEIMKSDYKGLRKRKKGRIRILYAYCKDCRDRGNDEVQGCAICEDMSDETIIFFYVGLKGILYED